VRENASEQNGGAVWPLEAGKKKKMCGKKVLKADRQCMPGHHAGGEQERARNANRIIP
jgi:hypothetical protein